MTAKVMPKAERAAQRSAAAISTELEGRRKRIEAGVTLDILHAIALCAKANTPIPDWLAQKYLAAFDSFVNPNPVRRPAHSLDEVFSSDSLRTTTRKKAASAKRDWELGVQLWTSVWDQVHSRPDVRSFDDALLAALKSQPWGIAKTKARKLVLLVEQVQVALVGDDELSRFLANRRQQVT